MNFNNPETNLIDDDMLKDMMDFIKYDKNKTQYTVMPDKSLEFTIDQGYMINSPDYGTYIVKFKNKKQLETILDKKIKSIVNYDLIFWLEAHRGTKYHIDFMESYPVLAMLKQSEFIKNADDIRHGTFDFTNFVVEKGFKYIDYINTHFPYFA